VIRWQPWQPWQPPAFSYVSGLDPFWQPLGNHGNQKLVTLPFQRQPHPCLSQHLPWVLAFF